MDQVVGTLFDRPWALLTWPALAMIAGTAIRALLGNGAHQIAIVPRTAASLPGVVTAPFVHANLAHLLANLPPFVVLGVLILRRGEPVFLRASIGVVIASGVLVWLFGRRAAHVGASGVVFGFFGFLVALACFTRIWLDVFIAGAVVVVYGSMLAGLAAVRKGTSFESHLFGLLSGVAAAWLEQR